MNPPISAAFATVPAPMRAPRRQREEQHEDGHALVRDAERERRVARDALVQHVPRRQAEARLEEAEDPARTEKKAGDEPGRPRGEPAAQDGSRAHARTLVEAP